MLKVDKLALICDLAETYNIYDYRSLPARTIATFAVGLRDDSRIKQRITDVKASRAEIILGAIADRLGMLWWALIQGGQGEIPESFVSELLGVTREEESSSNMITYSSPEEFESAREKIMKGGTL